MTQVSVICCFYNRPQAVRPTLLSLKNQTFRDFEAIIADDGSTDGITPGTLRTVIAEMNDPRFRLIERDANVGLTQGLIEGVKLAAGRLIAIHDAGDVSLPRRLEAQVALMDARPDVVVTGCHYVNYVPAMNLHRVRKPDVGKKSLHELIDDTTFTHGEVMFRRDAYEAAGGYRPEFRMSQDNDLWLRMRHLGKFATVQEVLYIRVVDFDGISFNPETVARQSAYYILGKRIARGDLDPLDAISRLQKGASITDVIPLKDGDAQRQIKRVVLRNALFGSPQDALRIARNYLAPSFGSYATQLAALSMASQWSRYIRPIVRRVAGLRSGPPHLWPTQDP